MVDPVIGRKNTGRAVYTDPKTGMHYSVDFTHGRFEQLRPNGKQIDEVDIDMRVMENKFDNAGGHDIIVSANSVPPEHDACTGAPTTARKNSDPRPRAQLDGLGAAT